MCADSSQGSIMRQVPMDTHYIVNAGSFFIAFESASVKRDDRNNGVCTAESNAGKTDTVFAEASPAHQHVPSYTPSSDGVIWSIDL